MFQALRDREGSRCPVLACDWHHARPLHSVGVMDLLDSHMVEAHPTTEWAKRVRVRRLAAEMAEGAWPDWTDHSRD